MTRAQAIALRAAAGLLENCVVVVTDGPIIGTAGNTSATEIELNPVSPTDLGLTARVNPLAFDTDTAWAGTYDIDLGVAGSITQLTDDWGNTAKDEDADSPTVQTQVPWHMGANGPFPAPFFRDNYFEDAVLTGWDTLPVSANITGNFIKNASHEVAVGAGPSLTLTDNIIEGVGVHRMGPANFNSWLRNTIRQGTLNWDARSTVSDSQILGAASVTSVAGALGNLTMSRAHVDDAAIISQQSTANNATWTFTNSRIIEGAQILNDAGSFKGANIFNSTIGGQSVIRLQGGTVVKALGVSRSHIYGFVPGDGIRMLGDVSLSINDSEVNLVALSAPTWLIDGPNPSSMTVNGKILGTKITRGPLAAGTTFLGQGNPVLAVGGQIIHDGSGQLALNRTDTGIDSIIRLAAGTTGNLSIDGGTVYGGTVAIDSGARSMSLFACNVLDDAQIINTGVGPSPPGPGDRLDNNTLDMRARILIQDTVAGTNTAHLLVGNHLTGTADVATNGSIIISGTSNGVRCDSNQVWGQLNLVDVPVGALGIATSMYDNYIGPGSVVTYTAGDGTGKQIRNNRIEGQSTLTLSALTGSAGAALGDLFACTISGQSAVTVSGARVVGFPIRNTSLGNQSVLTVSPGGALLQCALRAQANLTTGAFTHFNSIIDGGITKTATAGNTNRLANKSFDDWV